MKRSLSHLIGNGFIVLTYIRILLGVTIIAQSIFVGFGTVASVLFAVTFWESKRPTEGKARLVRGLVVFFASVVVDIIVYIFA